MRMMNLVVDSREQNRIEPAKEFFTGKGYDVEVRQLAVGDYLFDDRVVFEFKTQSDFINSILDNRVFNEAVDQQLEYPYHFVVIQGTNRDRKRAIEEVNTYQRFTLDQYYGAIARLNTYTTVIQSTGLLEDAFLQMHKQVDKCLDGKPVCKKFDNKAANPAFNALCYCLKDVKDTRARNIVDHLGLKTWSDVYHLTLEDLRNVPGIGDVLAEKIISQINMMG